MTRPIVADVQTLHDHALVLAQPFVDIIELRSVEVNRVVPTFNLRTTTTPSTALELCAPSLAIPSRRDRACSR